MITGINASNEDEETGWRDIANNPNDWASRTDKTGSEVYAADRLTGFQGHVFTLRYRSDLTLNMRILCEGNAHNIISIAEVGRRRYLEIVTETGQLYIESDPINGS